MTPFENDTGTIIDINVKLFGAAFFASVAWPLWPSTPEWWCFGLLSIILWFGSFLTLIEAISAIRKHRSRKRAIEEIEAAGSEPKSSTLANDDTLDKAGMRDG